MLKENKYSSPRSKPIKILFFVVVFIVIAGALSWLIMFLWNNILTEVTGVKPLTFWMAAGILLLSKILFGGFRRHKAPWKYSRRKEWRSKWMEMTNEERQEAKSRWKDHCRTRASKDMDD